MNDQEPTRAPPPEEVCPNGPDDCKPDVITSGFVARVIRGWNALLNRMRGRP